MVEIFSDIYTSTLIFVVLWVGFPALVVKLFSSDNIRLVTIYEIYQKMESTCLSEASTKQITEVASRR
jgi:hypothetical protein